MPVNFSFVEAPARDAVLAHYGLAKTANAPFPRFEDAVKIVSPLRRAGAGFLSGALPGAAVGGIAGALTADKPEDRMRRALMGAAAGTAVGGGLNAARHYTNQRELISEARKAYDFFGNDAIKAIAEAEGHLKKPDIPQAARSMYLTQLDHAKNNLKNLPTDIAERFEPKRTYLERLFQKQPVHVPAPASTSTHFGPETPDPIRKTHTSSGAPIYGPPESRGTAPYHPPDIPPPPPDLRAYQPPPPQRTGPISPDAAQMRADMGLEVTGSLNYQGIRPMKKLAFVGPMVEAEAKGLPSLLGYFVGRAQPMTEELAKKEIERDYDTFNGFVVPGYTGYHFGLRHAAGVHLNNLEKEKAKAIQDHAVKTAMAHYGLAKSSFVIGPNAASTARRVTALGSGFYGGLLGTGIGAVHGAYKAPEGKGFSGAIKGGLKGGAIGTAAGAGLGALRGHTLHPAGQDAIHQAMINIRDFHR